MSGRIVVVGWGGWGLEALGPLYGTAEVVLDSTWKGREEQLRAETSDAARVCEREERLNASTRVQKSEWMGWGRGRGRGRVAARADLTATREGVRDRGLGRWRVDVVVVGASERGERCCQRPRRRALAREPRLGRRESVLAWAFSSVLGPGNTSASSARILVDAGLGGEEMQQLFARTGQPCTRDSRVWLQVAGRAGAVAGAGRPQTGVQNVSRSDLCCYRPRSTEYSTVVLMLMLVL